MSGCDILEGVTVIVEVVDHDAPLLGVLVPAHLPQHLRGLAGEHGTEDELDVAGVDHR